MSEPTSSPTGQPSQWSSAGFKLARFGKGRNAIQSIFANDLVDALNPLGRIEIVRVPKSEGARDRVLYSDANVTLELLEQDLAPNVEGSVTVSEVDGTPSVANVTQIKFPAGTVTNDGGGVVTVAVGTITVEEQDASPSVANVSKIKFPNGTVTNDGSGVVSVTTSSSLTVQEDDGAPLVNNVNTIKFDGLEVTDDTGGVVTVRAPFATWGSGRGSDYLTYDYSEVTSTNYTNTDHNVLTIPEDGVYELFFKTDVSGTGNVGSGMTVIFETDTTGTWGSAVYFNSYAPFPKGASGGATFMAAGTEVVMRSSSAGLTSGSHSWTLSARVYQMV